MRPPRWIVTSLVLAATLSSCALQPPGSMDTPSPSTGQVTSQAPTQASSPSLTPSSSPSTSTPADDTLGPNGFGDLKLGVTKRQIIGIGLMRTGLLNGVDTATKGECGADGDGWLGRKRPAADDVTGRLFFSANTGKLVAIYAFSNLATPEGIRLGSTVAQVEAAYSGWTEEDGRGYAKVAGNPDATYRIQIVDNRVAELSLDSVDQDCYE